MENSLNKISREIPNFLMKEEIRKEKIKKRMKTLKQIRLLAYLFFMVVNPAWLLAAFAISFFSEEKAMDCLYGLHWFFFITLLLASPQLYHNYKINSNAKK